MSLKKRLRVWSSPRSKPLHERFPQFKIGRGLIGNPDVIGWRQGASLEIGAYCGIEKSVQIFLGDEHRWDWVTTYPFSLLWEGGKGIPGHPATKGDVIIGSDCWITKEAVIMSGVRIGHGAVVGARAVVAKDIPPYGIAVGNPAQVVKRRFDDATVERLLEICWWDWDDSRIDKALPKMLCDPKMFIEAYDRGEL
jgi:acetyltransferase-like isoleucine patch superfamily enzyme